MFEIFEHTADLGLRVRADTRENLFAEAARALYSVIVTNLDAVRSVEERVVRVEGADADYLLFDWLSELLYLFEVEHLLLVEYAIALDPTGLTARCRGERLDPVRHLLEHEVKAITYHGLRVERVNEEWLAEVIVDI